MIRIADRLLGENMGTGSMCERMSDGGLCEKSLEEKRLENIQEKSCRESRSTRDGAGRRKGGYQRIYYYMLEDMDRIKDV